MFRSENPSEIPLKAVNKFIVKTTLKMGDRDSTRGLETAPKSLKQFYDDCFYEITITTIPGYLMSSCTKRFKGFIEANEYHHELVHSFQIMYKRRETDVQCANV